MKRTVESINAPTVWKYGGTTFKLRIHATQDFKTSDGQFVLRSRNGSKDCYLEIDGEITGGDIPLIPTFEIDSTDDALVNPGVKYWAEFITQRGQRVPWTVAGKKEFIVPAYEGTNDPPVLTWPEIELRNEILNASRTRLGVPEFTSLLNNLLSQFDSLIAIAVGTLNDASNVIKGRLALDVSPIDPSWPEGVGSNSWAATDHTGIAKSSWPHVDPTDPIHVSDNDPRLGSLNSAGNLISTGSLIIGADSDANGVDTVLLQTRGVTRLKVNNDGITESVNGFKVTKSGPYAFLLLDRTDQPSFPRVQVDVDSGAFVVTPQTGVGLVDKRTGIECARLDGAGAQVYDWGLSFDRLQTTSSVFRIMDESGAIYRDLVTKHLTLDGAGSESTLYVTRGTLIVRDSSTSAPKAVLVGALNVEGLFRVQDPTATRYRTDIQINSFGLTTTAFDDTGSVFLPWQSHFLTFSFQPSAVSGNRVDILNSGQLVIANVTQGLSIGGSKVLGARETGWTAGTGTANKGAFATYAGQNVSAGYVEAEAQATDDAVKANSQRIKALEDMLRTHGVMN